MGCKFFSFAVHNCSEDSCPYVVGCKKVIWFPLLTPLSLGWLYFTWWGGIGWGESNSPLPPPPPPFNSMPLQTLLHAQEWHSGQKEVSMHWWKFFLLIQGREGDLPPICQAVHSQVHFVSADAVYTQLEAGAASLNNFYFSPLSGGISHVIKMLQPNVTGRILSPSLSYVCICGFSLCNLFLLLLK